ncbi:LOW QUALITY PROTEIN: hypothetical protein M514_24628 [Trichuris suis]|uniref:DUF7041 domain-containing protein n=1 Tax=Trichuris suis TaxID=68888 RepID=A0A085N107_9BILA|nr:LOW QUALITY PROTEIN: hypothetical protein M514_24628 [Trichuris suis]
MAKKAAVSPDSCVPTETRQPHVSTTLPVPAYMATDPELWFARLQLFFQHRHIQDEATMFELAMSAMPEESLSHLRDFILTADLRAAPFSDFKRLCLERLMEDRDHRIRQALTGEELADRTATAGVGQEDPILRQLFLSRLLQHLQATLLPSSEKPLHELALLADRLATLQAHPLPGTISAAQDMTNRVDRLERALQQSTVKVNSVSRDSRNPSPLPRQQQQRRSPSPRLRLPGDRTFCFYHRERANVHLRVSGETTGAHDANGRRCCPRVKAVASTCSTAVPVYVSLLKLARLLLPLSWASRVRDRPTTSAPILHAINGTPNPHGAPFRPAALDVDIQRGSDRHGDFRRRFHPSSPSNCRPRQLPYFHLLSTRRPPPQIASTLTQQDKFDHLLRHFVAAQNQFGPNPAMMRRELEHVEHVIETVGRPVYSKPRRLAPERFRIAKQHFDDLLRQGVVRPSNSSWSSPLHLVLKQQPRQWRPCGGFRNLNGCTKADRYRCLISVTSIKNSEEKPFFQKSTWHEPIIKFLYALKTSLKPL